MTHLARAIEIATEAHEGQTDKTGLPYSEHGLRVAGAVNTLDEKIVAWLHDVVEKAEGWSLERLLREGFSPEIVSAVDALTRRDGEDDQTFVRRAAANPLARPVKLADLEDNRHQAMTIGASTEKYDKGLAILNENGNGAMTDGKQKWSAEVTEHSDALDLEKNVFEQDDPKKIAVSLKRSAERSERRKAEPYRSAMSMLTFYINRAGKNLPARRKKTLEKAKGELRHLFGRD